MSDPLVLGIETSCDETGVAVIEGLEVRSSVLASQTDIHARFGGVVPEVAARAHVEAIRPLMHQAMSQAGVYSDQIDAVAATRGPGLVGALMVGFAFGKWMRWIRWWTGIATNRLSILLPLAHHSAGRILLFD